MSWSGLLAVAAGATLGAWLRWALSLGLNAWWTTMPLGTLTANLVGGYLVGIAVAAFAAMPQLAPEWRLFAVTGFLGGLTTFSTFSGEVVSMMLKADYGSALMTAGLHLLGSLALTALGIATWRWLATV